MNPRLKALLGIQKAQAATGGCIHRCYRVTIAGALRFLKVNEARLAGAFAAEAEGLEALRAAGMTAPAPLAHGVAGNEAYLLMEFLDLAGHGDFAALGTMLARAHRCSAAQFGWDRDNWIGATPQRNAWHGDWARFWLACRLQPQLDLARSNGYALASPPLERLAHHAPQPSLLHGDLWRGNIGFTAAGPAVFDPAVYYGDRETDLAMTELFGGFPRAFYSAYEAEFPLDPGYARRKDLYNLYHLLNHLNLFGGGYLVQVQATLRLLHLG